MEQNRVYVYDFNFERGDVGQHPFINDYMTIYIPAKKNVFVCY